MSEPEASERDSSLISKTLLYWGIQSVFLTKRNELWLCATQRFRMRNRIRKELWLSANGRFWMRSRLARNCGYARMGDLECAVDYHVLSS